MAVQFTGKRRLYTGPGVLAAGQQKCAISFFYRPEGDPSRAGGAFLFGRNYYSGPIAIMQNSSNGKSRVTFAWPMNGPTRPDAVHEFITGSVSHIAMTFDQGAQFLHINGIPVRMGKETGHTFAGQNALWMIGGADGSPPGVAFTIHDFAIWNGYVLTQDEIFGLRDGKIKPRDVGGTASLRAWWPLTGNPGEAPVAGRDGLVNAFGTGNNLSGIDGPGSAKFARDLDWSPSVQVESAYVATSGQSVGMRFRGRATGTVALAQVINILPTVKRGGVELGPLRDPWVNGFSESILMSLPLPEGVHVEPGEEVTISAPAGWMTTDQGLADALHDLRLDIRTGRSCHGSDELEKTLVIGVNMSPNETSVGGMSYVKDQSKRHDAFINAKHDAQGYPVELPSAWHIAGIWSNGEVNGLDDTGHPGPIGLHAIRWDELDPADPTTFEFSREDGYAMSDANMVITERKDLANPGTVQGGKVVGKVRVFDIQPAPGARAARRVVRLKIIAPRSRRPKYENLVIYGPGDFEFTDGQPVVLDISDRYGPPATMRERFVGGIGSLRWMEPTTENAGSSYMSEPEHLYNRSDYRWGFGRSSFNRRVGIRQARPLDVAASPYVYHNAIGSKYDVTLAAPIDATQTTIQVQYSEANPVFAYLRLFAGGETIRVDSVEGMPTDGQPVTLNVTRGREQTAPAAHPAGIIRAGYRFPLKSLGDLSLGNGLTMEVATDGPHGIWTGVVMNWRASGAYPVFAWADGTTVKASDWAALAWVTGLDTIAMGMYGPNKLVSNLSRIYDIDPAKFWAQIQVPWGGGSFTSYEQAASITGRFPGAALHLNIPYAASNDLVIEIFRRVRDNFPAGRNVIVELDNEPWNFGFAQWRYLSPLSRLAYDVPKTDPYPAQLERGGAVCELGRSVFDEGGAGRSGEIVHAVNVSPRPYGGLDSALNYAADHGIRVDAVACAPYINLPEDPADVETRIAINRYTTEQCVDLYTHHFRDNVSPYSYPLAWKAARATIARYAARTGNRCVLMGYEGGVEMPISGIARGPGSVSCAKGSRDVVGSGTRFLKIWRAGDLIRITAKSGVAATYTVHEVGDDTHLTLSAPYRGPTESKLGHGLEISNLQAKSRDMMLHPNWHVVEHDFYAALQQAGFKWFSVYRYAGPYYKGVYFWSMYGSIYQRPGRGDGSDGKLDNRKCRAMPRLPDSKAATTSQIENTVSVRGQALIDWNRAVGT